MDLLQLRLRRWLELLNRLWCWLQRLRLLRWCLLRLLLLWLRLYRLLYRLWRQYLTALHLSRLEPTTTTKRRGRRGPSKHLHHKLLEQLLPVTEWALLLSLPKRSLLLSLS